MLAKMLFIIFANVSMAWSLTHLGLYYCSVCTFYSCIGYCCWRVAALLQQGELHAQHTHRLCVYTFGIVVVVMAPVAVLQRERDSAVVVVPIGRKVQIHTHTHAHALWLWRRRIKKRETHRTPPKQEQQKTRG